MSCEDIPSLLDLQKVKKHADDFGRLMGTGTGTSTNGVTGQVRPTYNAVMSNFGYTRVGTFASGGTLTNGRQTLLWDIADGGDGQEYGWSGAFPPSGKIVSPGSTPLTTGGIAVGAWISRFDPEMRVQVIEALRRSYAEAGYTLVPGSFEIGGTVNTATDVLLYEAEGHAYNWNGVFPGGGKVVPPGSTPASTGGVGPGLWLDKSSTTLRSELLDRVPSILDYGGDASGVSDNASAASVMALDVGFVRFTRGSYLFGDVTIDCPIIFDSGAHIISNAGATVTITDSIESPRQWIFRGDGNYSLGHAVDSGENARQVHVSWFGAFPRPYSPSNPDQAPAFNKAMQAMGNGRESLIECDIGNYMMRSGVLMTRGAAIAGKGTRRTVFLHDTDGFVTFKTNNVACKLEGVQFEVYEPALPSRTSSFVGIEHGECEIYNVDVSNCKGAIYTTANNTRIKNVRGAYGQMQGAGTSVINVRGGNGHDIDGVYLGTSQYAPESAVLIGGVNQSSGIAGTRIQNISHIAPCASFKIEAKTGNIRKIEVDGFEYSGTTVAKPDYQAVISTSGSVSISGLIIDNGLISENATNGILFDNSSTGVISEVVLGDIIDSGTTGRGISFVENSGTLIGVSVTDGVRVESRAEPFYYSGQVDGVVISANALPNTTPAYCYDFTIADDSVATISLNRQVFTGFLFSSRGSSDYSQLVIRAVASPGVTRISGTASFAEVTTPLTGTTGADGKSNIGVTNGVIYIENRLGSSQRFNIVLMSSQ